MNTTSQTYAQALSGLPETVQNQILTNANRQPDEPFDYGSVYELLICAFQWDETPEGHDYWDQITLAVFGGELVLVND